MPSILDEAAKATIINVHLGEMETCRQTIIMHLNPLLKASQVVKGKKAKMVGEEDIEDEDLWLSEEQQIKCINRASEAITDLKDVCDAILTLLAERDV